MTACSKCGSPTESAVVLNIIGQGETEPMALCSDCKATSSADLAFLGMAFQGMVDGGVSREMANQILIAYIQRAA